MLQNTQGDTMPTKKDILDYLLSLKPELQEIGINKIGLFGSYAKDKSNIASDIDVAIESSQEFVDRLGGMKALIYLEELRKRIMRRFKVQVDLCDTASMSQERKNSILKGVIYV